MSEIDDRPGRWVTFSLDGIPVRVAAGTSVAAAVWNHGGRRFGTGVDGRSRAPLCGMGICFECRLTIDNQPGTRSCRLPVREGMVVVTAENPEHD